MNDVAPPFARSWRFLEHLRQTDHLRTRVFIVTTTHEAHLREFVGHDETLYEVAGKPFDLDRIVRAVKEASRARPARD